MPQVRVDPKAVFVWHLTLILCLTMGHLGVVLLLDGVPPFTSSSIRTLFDLGEEAGPGALASTLALLACAGAAAFAGSAERDRRQRRFWWLAAILAAFLAFDEAVAFHEKFTAIGRLVTDGRGVFTISWWAVYPLIFAPVLALAWPGLRRIGSPMRWRLVAAGIVYVSGAVGMEIVESALRDAFVTTHGLRVDGDIDWSAYAAALDADGADYVRAQNWLELIEEPLEMLGVALALRALLMHGAALGAVLQVRIGGVSPA